MHFTCQKDNFVITTDPATFNLDVIHGYLTRSYWRRGVSKDHVAKAINHSLGFGLFDKDEQIGFARVVTDYADFAYLSDVFVLEAYQGQGLGTWLIECVLACPVLQGLGRIALDTRDAQGLYRKFGFKEAVPNTHMQLSIKRPWFISE
jgi:GNAT superfamily N-acetyltransferase